MKLALFLLFAACTFVLASDHRDLNSNVWAKLANTTAISRRQTTWGPPAALVTPLQEVWDHQIETYNVNNGGLLEFENYGYDIINAGKGYVSIFSIMHFLTESQQHQLLCPLGFKCETHGCST